MKLFKSINNYGNLEVKSVEDNEMDNELSDDVLNEDKNPVNETESARKGVLIVDDSRFARMILKEILINEGYLVIGEAENGFAAVDFVKQTKPEYVFLDVEMPKQDGLSTIPGILEQDPEIQIIMCTAIASKKIITEANKAGAKDYVLKPYKKENILEVMRSITKRNGQVIPFKPAKKNVDEARTEEIKVEENQIEETKAAETNIIEEKPLESIANIDTQEKLSGEMSPSVTNEVTELLEPLENVEEVENSAETEEVLESYINEQALKESSETIESEETKAEEVKTAEEINGEITEAEENKVAEEITETEEAKATEGITEAEEAKATEEINGEITEVEENKATEEVTEAEEAKTTEEITEAEEAKAVETVTETEEAKATEETAEIERTVTTEDTIESENAQEVTEDISSEDELSAVKEESLELSEEKKEESEEISNANEAIEDTSIAASLTENVSNEYSTIESQNSREDKTEQDTLADAPAAVLETKQEIMDNPYKSIKYNPNTDSTHYAYLWDDRFNTLQYTTNKNPKGQRVAFTHYINMENDRYDLLGKDNAERKVTLGMISAYMSSDDRFQQRDMTACNARMITYTKGVRLFAYNILEVDRRKDAEISMTDVLQLSKNMTKQSFQVNMKNNCLYKAVEELVHEKSSRIFGKSFSGIFR